MTIAADSSTLTATISPTDSLAAGSVLNHWDLKKTGYIATNVPTADTENQQENPDSRQLGTPSLLAKNAMHSVRSIKPSSEPVNKAGAY